MKFDRICITTDNVIVTPLERKPYPDGNKIAVAEVAEN